MNADVFERVLRRVDISDRGCWEFQGCRLKSGYGRVGWGSKLLLTHRVTYMFLVGPVPDGLELDHLCKNKSCCNPGHLEAVTRSENIRRGTQWHHLANRERSKTHCRLGHPYDAANTYVTARGCRQCRICKRIAGDKYAQSHREILAQRSRINRESRKATTV